MDKNYRSRQLRKYFAKLKLKVPAVLLVFGFLLARYGYGEKLDGIGQLGLIAVLSGAGWITYAVLNRRSAPSDETVDAWLREDLSHLIATSYEKLGLEKSQLAQETPLVICAPVYWHTRGIPPNELLYRKGRDKMLRFAVYRVTIFLLAEHLLGSYICDYNFIRKVALNEKTYEYHYQDVVSVATEESSGSYTLPEGQRFVNAQKFRLSVASGERIEILINPQIVADMSHGKLPATGAERAVSVIRAMLRDKKAPQNRS